MDNTNNYTDATYQNNSNPATSYVTSSGASSFVEPDEVALYSLKNGFATNLLSGEIWKTEDAVVTNKRLYYSNKVGLINKITTEEIIDLKDITGTKITDAKPLVLIVLAAIAFLTGLISLFCDAETIGLICLLIGFVSVFAYTFFMKSFLKIEYAGGNIHFSVKKYSLKTVREFQRVIYRVRKG